MWVAGRCCRQLLPLHASGDSFEAFHEPCFLSHQQTGNRLQRLLPPNVQTTRPTSATTTQLSHPHPGPSIPIMSPTRSFQSLFPVFPSRKTQYIRGSIPIISPHLASPPSPALPALPAAPVLPQLILASCINLLNPTTSNANAMLPSPGPTRPAPPSRTSAPPPPAPSSPATPPRAAVPPQHTPCP